MQEKSRTKKRELRNDKINQSCQDFQFGMTSWNCLLPSQEEISLRNSHKISQWLKIVQKHVNLVSCRHAKSCYIHPKTFIYIKSKTPAVVANLLNPLAIPFLKMTKDLRMSKKTGTTLEIKKTTFPYVIKKSIIHKGNSF